MKSIETIMGKMIAPEWNEDLIIRSLSELGEWARIEQLLAASLVQAGDALWDGGAFLGTFGIGVAQLAAAAGRSPSRLVAIDPGAALAHCLAVNLQSLAPCSSQLVSCAIFPEIGFVAVEPSTDSEVNHGGIAYVRAEAPSSIIGRPLWHLRQEFGDYDFLKLDLEGGEFDALRSDFDYIKSKTPVIWAECNESMQSIRLLEAMVALGYAPQYLAFPSFRPIDGQHGGKAPYPMAYEAVLLAAKPDRQIDLAASGMADQIIWRNVSTSWDLRQALWATPRWAMEDWISMPRHELIGILGKVLHGKRLQDYLTD